MEMMVRVDKRARQPSGVKQLPLGPDFIAHQLPRAARQTNGPGRAFVRITPGPCRAGDWLRAIEVQMPADLEVRDVTDPVDGVFRVGLAHHQAGAPERAPVMGVDDGPVDLRAHSKIVSNEKHFSVIHGYRRF
jgi:hypothetical protein